MKVLVTGGAGYIGSHTVEALLKAHHEVIVVDDLSTGTQKFISSAAKFIKKNVGDSDIESLLRLYGIQAIIHLAAFIKVDESVKDPMKYYRNNVTATANLIEAAVRAGVKYFVFSSTAAVYGNPAVVPIREDGPLEPLSPYGHSKLMGERMLEDACSASSMRFIALRYFNVMGTDVTCRYGYKLESQPSHLGRKALAVALGREKSLDIYGTDYPTLDGTAIRDYVHVNDIAEAHVFALGCLETGAASRVYNVGNGKGYSVLEVVTAVEKVIGRKLPTKMASRRPGDSASIVANVDRIQSELGWKPNFSLEDMVCTQLQFERSQQEVETKQALRV